MGGEGEYNFVLAPLAIEVLVNINKDLENDMLHPKIDIKSILQSIKVELHEMQYNQLLRVIQWVTQYNTREHKLSDIPEAPIQAQPMEHWKYILTRKRDKVRKLRSILTSEYIDKRRKTRIEYSALWKEHILTKSFLKSSRLKELEEELSYEDIAYFRLRAESEIRPEDLPTSSWSSWCLSWVSASGVYLPEKTQQQALSEENLDFFYEAMGISKKDSGATQTEDVRSFVLFTLFLMFL